MWIAGVVNEAGGEAVIGSLVSDDGGATFTEGAAPNADPERTLQRELWDFFQVAIGPDGRLHIAYVTKFKDNAPETWYIQTKSGPSLR